MPHPLDGLRILDLTNVMAGPFCGYQLALLGAEVVKIEVPGSGDLARQLGADPALNRKQMGISFLAQNAGKKSVTLNLKSDRGRALFLELVKTADAVIESFRPGVMKRLGVDARTLRTIRPRLVVCSISGFGQNGPMASRPAYDQIIQGLSGIMSVTGDEDSAPLRVGFPVSDAIAGLNAAMAVSAALAGAARTGDGATLDVSMLDSTIVTAAWVVSNYHMSGQAPRPMGNENRTASPSGTFRTGDGLLNIAANKQEQWENVADAVGLSHLKHDPRFSDREARKTNRAILRTLLEQALASRSALAWENELNACGVPAGRVLSVPDALDLDQANGRNLFRTYHDVAGVDRPVKVANGGFLIADEGRANLPPPATLGAHTAEILGEIGVDPTELRQLAQDGIV